MTPESAIVARIVALGTAAGSRVYLMKLPESVAMPAVCVQVISESVIPHLRGGGSHLRVARVQVDAYDRESSGADPYGTVATLADAIVGDDGGSGLSGYRGTLSGLAIEAVLFVDRQALYDPEELRLVRMRQDFYVWYRPA